VPGLDDARIGGREIDLAELLKPGVVSPHDLAEPAALVGDDAGAASGDSVDQGIAAADQKRFVGEDDLERRQRGAIRRQKNASPRFLRRPAIRARSTLQSPHIAVNARAALTD